MLMCCCVAVWHVQSYYCSNTEDVARCLQDVCACRSSFLDNGLVEVTTVVAAVWLQAQQSGWMGRLAAGTKVGGVGRLALLGMATSHFTVFLYFAVNIPFATLTDGNRTCYAHTSTNDYTGVNHSRSSPRDTTCAMEGNCNIITDCYSTLMTVAMAITGPVWGLNLGLVYAYVRQKNLSMGVQVFSVAKIVCVYHGTNVSGK